MPQHTPQPSPNQALWSALLAEQRAGQLSIENGRALSLRKLCLGMYGAYMVLTHLPTDSPNKYWTAREQSQGHYTHTAHELVRRKYTSTSHLPEHEHERPIHIAQRAASLCLGAWEHSPGPRPAADMLRAFTAIRDDQQIHFDELPSLMDWALINGIMATVGAMLASELDATTTETDAT